MSGHSKWANIKRKKGKNDAIRGKITTKIGREITIAVRMGGPDPVGNMRLKLALQKAKENNIPKDNIKRAIQKGAGATEGQNYEEIVYEGYGPAGVAVTVNVLTDNRNRAAAAVRHEFSKSGGNLGATGCVSWMFHNTGIFVVKAFAYLTMLGREGVHEVGRNAVLNANYMMAALQDIYDMAYPGPCMHEFVMTLDRLHKETGVSALDIAKGLLDNGIHPPTMYFPLIVHEALMVEPTETESKATMDEAIEVFRALARLAHEDPEALHTAPHNTPVRRLDEVRAARNPVLRAALAE